MLGLRGEGAWYDEIPARYPGGVIAPDPQEKERPMDDDLAQAVELALALLAKGDVVRAFAPAPGTLAAQERPRDGPHDPKRHQSAGSRHLAYEAARVCYERNPIAPNGGLMRCAPVAVAHQHAPERLIHDSAATCAVTHYAHHLPVVLHHPQCRHRPAAPGPLTRMCPPCWPQPQPTVPRTCTLRPPQTAFQRTCSPVSPPPAGPPSADTSWLCRDQHLIGHTLLTLQVGLWAAVTTLNFEDALVQVVRAGGDTDTNAAVAGAVLGARYGATAIPDRWLECIPDLERIDLLATLFATFNQIIWRKRFERVVALDTEDQAKPSRG